MFAKDWVTCAALLILSVSFARAGEIAITIDDLPYMPMSRTTPDEGLRQVEAVNQALAKHGIVATGFAVGSQINEDSRPALEAFSEAGHTIGNHTWSHPDYGTLWLWQFKREVRRTDDVLAEWMPDTKFFRFPYLREGPTEKTKRAAEVFLEREGYINAPVTIDNDEWRFNAAYLDAVEAGDTAEAAEIARDYLAHMKERTAHFHDLAESAFGRDVSHILLLHMNRINADHLGALLQWYADEDWRFVTLEEAMRDPIYSMPDIYSGHEGLSQIERVLGGPSQ